MGSRETLQRRAGHVALVRGASVEREGGMSRAALPPRQRGASLFLMSLSSRLLVAAAAAVLLWAAVLWALG